MSLVHGLLFGMGMLILVYLGVKNADGVTAVFNATGSNTNNIVRTLQGR